MDLAPACAGHTLSAALAQTAFALVVIDQAATTAMLTKAAAVATAALCLMTVVIAAVIGRLTV